MGLGPALHRSYVRNDCGRGRGYTRRKSRSLSFKFFSLVLFKNTICLFSALHRNAVVGETIKFLRCLCWLKIICVVRNIMCKTLSHLLYVLL